MTRIAVVGCGELGGRVAGLLAQTHWVVGVTRTEARHPALIEAGVEPRLMEQGPLEVDAVLFSVPGSAAQRLVMERWGVGAPRVVLVSSTAVYAGLGGRLDEQTALLLPTERARAAFGTERWLHERRPDAVVLRMGGLYRVGRGPAAVARRAGVRPGPPDRALPLLHYDDAAQAAVAALLHVAPEPCYLAVSPPCPTRAQFYGALGVDAAFTTSSGQEPVHWDVSLLRRDLLAEPRWPHWEAALT